MLLTLIFGYRDRDVERIKRCLNSLQQQTFRDFTVIFVDYGSSTANARAAQNVVEQYSFCRYIYSDTRGYPWNRSRALNIGGRLATSPFLITTDVDMIYPPDFLQHVADQVAEDRMLYCYHHFLPANFDDWNNLCNYAGKLPKATKEFLGACHCVPTEIFHQIRGFDEYYQYWGKEDTDINVRLKQVGLKEVWLNDWTYMFHQWHPASNFKTAGFMPDGLWGRVENYFHRNQGYLVRNSKNWGQIHCPETRPILALLDIEQQKIIKQEHLIWFDEHPDNNRKIGDFVQQFWSLSPGQGIGIEHAAFPYRHILLEILIRYTNKLLRLANYNSKVNYSTNLLHSFLAEFIELNQDIVADYYLNFPERNGISLLIRK
ncbi:MAG: glycosyltransferase [Caldilineaceae bacterium]